MKFLDLLLHQRGPEFVEDLRHTFITGIDPGETTGICTFYGARLEHTEQLRTKEVASGAATIADYMSHSFIAIPNEKGEVPEFVVMEEYRVYAWKTKTHAWAGLHTPRLIGALEYITHERGLPLILQSAGEGKGFCTDEKLTEWGMYQTAKRHANDSIRHVCHALLFSKALKL